MSLACGIDVGGTKIAGGVVDEDGMILEELRVESPATDAEAIEEAIAGLVTELRSRHEIATVGVGAAGYVDKARAVVLFAPNVAWRNEDLKGELEKRVQLPVVIENDANAAATALPAAAILFCRSALRLALTHCSRAVACRARSPTSVLPVGIVGHPSTAVAPRGFWAKASEGSAIRLQRKIAHRESELEGRDRFRPEAELERRETSQASNQEPRAHQERRGHGDLGDDQELRESRLGTAGAPSPSASKRRSRVAADRGEKR